jgi:hypothetical protein
VQEEKAMEKNIDFVTLVSTNQPAAVAPEGIPRSTAAEQEMWNDYMDCEEVFDAGVDPTLAAIKERKRLEREATEFDLWQGADFLPEDSDNINNCELLLDELEQEDILTELMQNASE